jgi:hypothetical protein
MQKQLMLAFHRFRAPLQHGLSRRGLFTGSSLLAIVILLLGTASLRAQDADKRGVLGNIPDKIDGRWPNDARDTFWYSDYETASRVSRESQRPILLVINRGAPCEV